MPEYSFYIFADGQPCDPVREVIADLKTAREVTRGIVDQFPGQAVRVEVLDEGGELVASAGATSGMRVGKVFIPFSSLARFSSDGRLRSQFRRG